eukprot:5758577-Amphidinium_carterae.2
MVLQSTNAGTDQDGTAVASATRSALGCSSELTWCQNCELQPSPKAPNRKWAKDRQKNGPNRGRWAQKPLIYLLWGPFSIIWGLLAQGRPATHQLKTFHTLRSRAAFGIPYLLHHKGSPNHRRIIACSSRMQMPPSTRATAPTHVSLIASLHGSGRTALLEGQDGVCYHNVTEDDSLR